MLSNSSINIDATDSPPADSSSDDNTGIIAVIVVGIVIFIILHIPLAIVIIWCIVKRKRRSLTIPESKLF